MLVAPLGHFRVSLGATHATGGASAAMTTLPWSIIPLCLVPTYLIGHALVFAHVRASMTTSIGGRRLARS